MALQLQSYNQIKAFELLIQAGVPQRLLKETTDVARNTIELWLDQEIEQGNLPLVLQMVNGQTQVNLTNELQEEFKDLLVAKFIVRLNMEYPMALKAATVLLPCLMKTLVEHMQLNPQFTEWQKNMETRKSMSVHSDRVLNLNRTAFAATSGPRSF